MTTTPDYKASIEFLLRFHPNYRWVLTSIHPETRFIVTRSFDAARRFEAEEWIAEQGAENNIYFSVGLVDHDLNKKATREELAGVGYFHVDIDCGPNETVAKEKLRIVTELRNPKHCVPPTLIVDSGGGFWGYWKLNQTLPCDGSLLTADELGRYNKQLELLLGGDNCFDISRIARLPGTVNWPDRKKIEKGREPQTATIVEWYEDRVYSVDLFDKADISKLPRAPLVQGQGSFEPPKNVVRTKDLSLLTEVPPSVRVVINLGHNPDNPNQFPSRSEAVWYVVMSLVTSGVSDEVIYGILTDPEFKISESILEQQNSRRDYAMRQIARAREQFALNPASPPPDRIKPSPMPQDRPLIVTNKPIIASGPRTPDEYLKLLNERHAVISNMGGKCVVIEELYDKIAKRSTLSKQALQAVEQRYMNIFIPISGSKRPMPLGYWWLNNPDRRQYERVVFNPDGDEEPTEYNLWQGFICVPSEGSCKLFLDHVYKNVCNSNEEYYEYLLNWMAKAVQEPAMPGQTAIVLRGRMGTGKGFFIRTFGELWGRHFISVTDPSHLTGKFNGHLRDCVVLFADEAFYAGDKKHESVLKMLITERMIAVEAKSIDTEMSNNFIHLMMSSNSNWVVPMAMDDRRFFVLDVNDSHRNDTDYFEAITAELNSGGREALLYLLKNKNLADFKVQRIPQTGAGFEQKMVSLDPFDSWWYDKIQSGKLLKHHGDWKREISSEELRNDFLGSSRDLGIIRRINIFTFELVLSRLMGWEGKPFPQYISEKSVEISTPQGMKNLEKAIMYRLPPLAQCRIAWERYVKHPIHWPVYSELPDYGQNKIDFPETH